MSYVAELLHIFTVYIPVPYTFMLVKVGLGSDF